MTLGLSLAPKLLKDKTIVRLYEYFNPLSGRTALAAFEDPHYDDTATSPFVENRVILKDEGGVTNAGKKYLEDVG